uniref:Uncharacterized protein n=2 Tax=Lygus hesperus TaxID=30085 RepID=A0A146LLX3_LYGHE
MNVPQLAPLIRMLKRQSKHPGEPSPVVPTAAAVVGDNVLRNLPQQPASTSHAAIPCAAIRIMNSMLGPRDSKEVFDSETETEREDRDDNAITSTSRAEDDWENEPV